jgi:hypothetical protein
MGLAGRNAGPTGFCIFARNLGKQLQKSVGWAGHGAWWRLENKEFLAFGGAMGRRIVSKCSDRFANCFQLFPIVSPLGKWVSRQGAKAQRERVRPG